MDDYLQPADLLNRNLRELPEKDLFIENFGKVRIRALAGYNAMMAGDSNLADTVVISITHGLIKPRLKPSMVKDFVDHNLADSQFIAGEIGTLTREFNQFENKVKKEAKKN